MLLALALVLEVVALLALGVATVVAVTGGGVFDVAGLHISATRL